MTTEDQAKLEGEVQNEGSVYEIQHSLNDSTGGGAWIVGAMQTNFWRYPELRASYVDAVLEWAAQLALSTKGVNRNGLITGLASHSKHSLSQVQKDLLNAFGNSEKGRLWIHSSLDLPASNRAAHLINTLAASLNEITSKDR